MKWTKIKTYLQHYFYGMVVKSFNGGISAMDAFLGLAAGAAVTSEVHAINWQGAVAVFGVTFLRTALSWLRDHPFPEQLPGDQQMTNETK